MFRALTCSDFFDILWHNIIIAMSISSVPIPSTDRVPVAEATSSKPSSGPRVSVLPGIGSDRRGTTAPERQLNRRLFDNIANLIHRYSHDPFEKDDQGQYTMTDEKVRQFLKAEVAELEKLDPLIPLLLEIENKYSQIPVEDGRLKVGSYKIIFPSIKDLNDTYLGPNKTNDLMDEINIAVGKELHTHNAQLLNTNFKGGVFFMDLGPSNGHTTEEHAAEMQNQLVRIQEIAKNILIKHLSQHHDDLYERVSEYSLEAISENQRQLTDLKMQLERNEKKVEIAFGFDDIHTQAGITSSIRNILSAERGANMASRDQQTSRKNGNHHEGVRVRDYQNKDLLVEIMCATLNLYYQILDEEGELKPGWEEFFTRDGDAIRMRRSMIQKKRKINQFRDSTEYKTMPEQDREDFEEKFAIFSEYYEQINVVDVLKKFTFDSFPIFSDRIERIIKLIQKAETRLADPESDSESLRYALGQTSHELELSLKDRGKKIIHTTRATIKALMTGENSILVMGDNIGFAGLNQAGYEDSAQRLIETLGLSGEDIQSVVHERADGRKSIDRRKMDALVKRKLKKAESTKQFEEVILSIGDEGTTYLRDNEEILYGAFNGNPKLNADGGDETNLLYTEANGCHIPEDPLEIERTLFRISEQAKIRIAAVYGDMSFSKMPEYDHAKGVPQKTRKEIIRYQRVLQFAEIAHDRIKAAQRTVVEIQPADKFMT